VGGVSFVGIIVVIAAAAAIRCWYHTYCNKLDVRATSNILCTPTCFGIGAIPMYYCYEDSMDIISFDTAPAISP